MKPINSDKASHPSSGVRAGSGVGNDTELAELGRFGQLSGGPVLGRSRKANPSASILNRGVPSNVAPRQFSKSEGQLQFTSLAMFSLSSSPFDVFIKEQVSLRSTDRLGERSLEQNAAPANKR
jgi:hypothetical protein